jgi:hypothetical protein
VRLPGFSAASFSRAASAGNSAGTSLEINIIKSRVADFNLQCGLIACGATVQVHTNLSSLPDAIKGKATKQRATNNFAGVYHSGKVHIYAPHIRSG